MTHDERDQLLAGCYRRVLRPPTEGTAGAAITQHATACGLVAYVMGVHPDTVARAVAAPAPAPQADAPLPPRDLDDLALDRAIFALSRFIFPGYVVPRSEMAAAVLVAVSDSSPDWINHLPAKHIARGAPE